MGAGRKRAVDYEVGDVSKESEDESPLTSTFCPQSKVLRHGPITFDSDDESMEPLPQPSSRVPYVERDAKKIASEIACRIDETMKLVVLDSSVDVALALEALPSDTWETLLSDQDRQHLLQYLPNLRGWNDLPSDEATRANLRSLFTGENFHFGNPVSRLRHNVVTGSQTQQAVASREAVNADDATEFDHKRCASSRQRLMDVVQTRRAFVSESQTTTGERPNKRIRVSTDRPFILRNQDVGTTRRVTKNSSLFLAIREILKNAPTHQVVDADYVWTTLQATYPTRIPLAKDLDLFLDPQRYVQVALNFLSDQHTEPDPAHDNATKQLSLMKPFVSINAKSGSMEWVTGPDDDSNEMIELLVLEQVFRAPFGNKAGSKSEEVDQMRHAIKRHFENQAIDELRQTDSLFIETESVAHARTSTLLKRASVALHDESIWNVDAFHAQERRRYASSDQPTTYKNVSTDDTVTVGPVFTQARTRWEADLLTKGAPATVTILNLVYDACARLPGQHGTRADIKTLLIQSQYVRSSAVDSAIDLAVVHSLDELARTPPRSTKTPCVRFDGDRACWVYDHPINAWSVPESEGETHPPTPSTPSKLSIKNLLG